MKKNNELVSVIVPIYNAEKYLDECIKSIINQTYKNIEILLINNNSTDRSRIICQNYAKNDSRVEVYDEKNSGVSYARNLGLKSAKGKYIFFVDSDDWIRNDTLEVLINNIAENVLVGIQKMDGKKYRNESTILQKGELIEQIFTGKKIGADWLYLFDRDIINFKFDTDTNYLEDTLFLMEYLKNINYVKFINKECYYYRTNVESITKKCTTKSIISNVLKIHSTIKKIITIVDRKYEKLIYKRENFIIIYEICKVNNKKSFIEICESDITKIISELKNSNLMQKKFYKAIYCKDYKLYRMMRLLLKIENKIKSFF